MGDSNNTDFQQQCGQVKYANNAVIENLLVAIFICCG